MAGSNLIAVKRALVAVLPGALGIAGAWSATSKLLQSKRECFYLGDRASGPVQPAAHAAGARFPRQEDVTLSVAIEVRRPGRDTTEEAEVDALAYGRLLEEYLAGNWLLGGDIPGLLKVLVTDFEVESSIDDDGASSTLTYSLQAESHVR